MAKAIRELRARFRDNQQDFAARLGWGVATVARYELDRVAKGRAVADLWRLAKSAGYDDLARFFYSELIAGNPEEADEPKGTTLEEDAWIRATIRIIRDRSGPEDLAWLEARRHIVSALDSIHERMVTRGSLTREQAKSLYEELLDCRELLRFAEYHKRVSELLSSVKDATHKRVFSMLWVSIIVERQNLHRDGVPSWKFIAAFEELLSEYTREHDRDEARVKTALRSMNSDVSKGVLDRWTLAKPELLSIFGLSDAIFK
jgi:transcriptional regulator with XRE-family HTH domain